MLLLILIPLVLICTVYHYFQGWDRAEFRYWFQGFRTIYTPHELIRDIIVVLILGIVVAYAIVKYG